MMKAVANQFIGCDKTFEEAKVVLFGAPYDSTTSFRPGTRFGPDAMRRDSFGVETYSMHLDKDLVDDASVFDSGDIELPFGRQEEALEMIEARTTEILDAGKIPFMLGGEHLVTLGAVRAAFKKYPDLHIIHFDAHADLREEYLGNKLSHACVMRRCHDILGDGRIFQFGIRSGTREERQFMRDGHVFFNSEFGNRDSELTNKLINQLAGKPIYLTIDMDVLDPSEFPGTGTPEAGGFTYLQLLNSVSIIMEELNVVAVDNVELSPALDPTGRSTALACKFLREQLLLPA